MSRYRAFGWIRLLAGVVILGALVWHLGAAPFLDGISMIDGRSLAGAAVITLLTTACCAWRWRLVARGLGIDLPLGTAIAAYYRSQFLNSTVPGGVVGDVHRGVVHGRDSGDVLRGLRAVAWERASGQAVQLLVALIVLALLPSPVRSWMPLFAAVVAAAGVGIGVVVLVLPADGSSLWVRAVRTSVNDIHSGVLVQGQLFGVLLASVAATAGHVAIFLLAARAVGATEPLLQLLPLAMLVLLAMSVPLSIAGWGPREGVAAWAFAAAGLGAGQGLSVAVVYGVLAFVSCLPGAFVLIGGWIRRDSRDTHSPELWWLRRAAVTGGADVAVYGAGEGSTGHARVVRRRVARG